MRLPIPARTASAAELVGAFSRLTLLNSATSFRRRLRFLRILCQVHNRQHPLKEDAA
jgi:hypothetical protein